MNPQPRMSENPQPRTSENETPNPECPKTPNPERPKYKNVHNLILGSTLKLWGCLGFVKNSFNTIHVLYFRKALCKSTSKFMSLGVKNKLISVSTLQVWGRVVFSKIHGTPFLWYIFRKPSVRGQQEC